MSIQINKLHFSLLRIFLIIAIQVLVIKNIRLPWDKEGYGLFLFYPVAIMFLPSQLSKPITLIIAFCTGITVDVFYDTPGVGAGALVAMAYARPLAFEVFEVRLGIKLGQESHTLNPGFFTLLMYAAVLLLIFCFCYFSFEYFTIYYIEDIIIKTIYSFLLSLTIVALYIVIFRPKI